jgi:hypothetical protein
VTCQQDIVELRQARKTYRQIRQELRIGHSTVARLLRRQGLNRLANLEPAPSSVRYEYAHPGGLLHLDIKKLDRFTMPGHRITADRQKQWDGLPLPPAS